MEILVLGLMGVLLIVGVVIGFRIANRNPQVKSRPDSDAGKSAGQTSTAPKAEVPELDTRLAKTRQALSGFFGSLGTKKIDEETFKQLSDALILADFGLETTQSLMDRLQTRHQEEKLSPDQLARELKTLIVQDLQADRSLKVDANQTIWFFVGVNGVGKTTTIGKIAQQAVNRGQSVLLVAADTFRAAAADQLAIWAERTGAGIVRSESGADPGSVLYDALDGAKAKGYDLVLVDTAGRLHTDKNLMEELKKLRRIVGKVGAEVDETLLVIDATTGQNGLRQAQEFTSAVEVSGIVLTKLDGTAKGGIVLPIQSQLGVAVKRVGVGEGLKDLIEFDPQAYAEAIIS